MQIKQWENKNLSHFSYAVLSDCEKKIILIDPFRNPGQYYEYAKQQDAQIVGVIETHPHADFVSSHLEIHKTTGAIIYTSKLAGVGYPNETLGEGNTITLGKIFLSSLDTPGHSPDSISIVLEHEGKKKAVFTGDTLFIGDCGRPDLRESTGNIKLTRDDLAKKMYHSLRNKLMQLPDDTLVYPAHGAGTLCGKTLSKAASSTIGAEKLTNWSLQQMSEENFIKKLLADQPFIPAYFPYDVELNRKGAKSFQESIVEVKIGFPVKDEASTKRLNKQAWIIDTRNEKDFKSNHLPRSINLMKGLKFETWLGSIIKPGESFYLAGDNIDELQKFVERAGAIGYEGQILEIFILEKGNLNDEILDIPDFKEHPDKYTIIDVRTQSEVKEKKIFPNSIPIPLGLLRYRMDEIPTNKPIVVHCAGGYRSAAASSLIQSGLTDKVKVFDMGEAIKEFDNHGNNHETS